MKNSLKHGGGQQCLNSGRVSNNNWDGVLKQHENWLEKTKSALMVVAVLIASIAFQARVNPPGGVSQEDQAVWSVLAREQPGPYSRFYITNTIAFVASLTIILLLMSGLPLRRRFLMWILMVLTWIAITTIALCYLYATTALTPTFKYDMVPMFINVTLFVWLILMALMLIAHTIRMVVKLVKKTRKRLRP